MHMYDMGIPNFVPVPLHVGHIKKFTEEVKSLYLETYLYDIGTDIVVQCPEPKTCLSIQIVDSHLRACPIIKMSFLCTSNNDGESITFSVSSSLKPSSNRACKTAK